MTTTRSPRPAGRIAQEHRAVHVRHAFKNKGVQPLLDAVIDFLPSPIDMPPVEGHCSTTARRTRKAARREPFAALAFKILTIRSSAT